MGIEERVEAEACRRESGLELLSAGTWRGKAVRCNNGGSCRPL